MWMAPAPAAVGVHWLNGDENARTGGSSTAAGEAHGALRTPPRLEKDDMVFADENFELKHTGAGVLMWAHGRSGTQVWRVCVREPAAKRLPSAPRLPEATELTPGALLIPCSSRSPS